MIQRLLNNSEKIEPKSMTVDSNTKVAGPVEINLTLKSWGFFFDIKGLGGGVGFHRKSSNIAIGQFNALKSWPYTSKFTYDHPEQIETIFKSIGGFGKFWGAVEHVRSKIQILSDF